MYFCLFSKYKPVSEFKEVEHAGKIIGEETVLFFPNGFKFTNRGEPAIADRLRFVDFEFNYMFDAIMYDYPVIIANGDTIEMSCDFGVVLSVKELD